MKEKKGVSRFKAVYLLYSMMAVIFILLSVFTASLLQKQKYDALRINLSGRQRMLTQKLSKEIALFSLGKISPEEINSTVRIFDLTLKGLYDGGDVPEDLEEKNFRRIPPADSEEIREQLLTVLSEWESYKKNAYSYLQTGDRVAFEYVINRNLGLLENVDRSVKMMESVSEWRTGALRLTLSSAVAMIMMVLAVMLAAKVRDIRIAREQIRELEKMLPICANCKKIRRENGDPYDQRSWVKLEEFLKKERDITFSHGLCPDCAEKLYPGILKDKQG